MLPFRFSARSVTTLLVIVSAAHIASAQGREQYDAYLSALKTAVIAGDADALADLVTNDRVSVSGASGRTMRGREAQRAADKEFFSGYKIVTFDMKVTEFKSSDSLAYAAGIGVHTVEDRANGARKVDRFQYLDVLVREADGHWRSRYFMNAPVEPGK
jgi:uncharacterized protein (TIGR02246 family)